MINDYVNKNVLITGASKGIGKTIKEMFEERGACVCAPSRAELELSDPKSVDAYLNSNADKKIDVIILCAGVNRKTPIEKITDEIMNETFQVNLFSSIRIIQQYIDRMKDEKKGKILFISSLYAIVSKEDRIPYSCSKNAITGLVKTLALECAPYGICVNAVAPGYVLTEMTQRNLSKGEIEEIKELIPMKRLQEKEEIAELVLFLSSDRNKSITGQVIPVDGGFLCR